MIIYDIKCENGHKFEGWFKDREAWLEQSAQKLVCCPVCHSANVEIAPSSIAIMGKRGKKKDESNRTQTGFVPSLQSLHQYIAENFEDVGSKFSEVALKIHFGEEENETSEAQQPLRKKSPQRRRCFVYKNPTAENGQLINF